MTKAEEVSEKPLKKIIVHNFVGGVAWGLGITVGASIIFALGAFLLSKVDYVPVIGKIVISVSEFVEENDPNLLQ